MAIRKAKHVGERIKLLRSNVCILKGASDWGITQAELARRLGKAQHYITYLEKAKTVSTSRFTYGLLIALATEFSVTLDFLLVGSDKEWQGIPDKMHFLPPKDCIKIWSVEGKEDSQ